MSISNVIRGPTVRVTVPPTQPYMWAVAVATKVGLSPDGVLLTFLSPFILLIDFRNINDIANVSTYLGASTASVRV